MKNTRLAEIIVDPSSCSGDEARDIKTLTDQFPYSSFLHILKAKIAAENKIPDKEKLLTRAAIISPDRSQLKQYITTKNIFADYTLVMEPVLMEPVLMEPVTIEPVTIEPVEKATIQIIPEEIQAIESIAYKAPLEEKTAPEILPEELNPLPPPADKPEQSLTFPTGRKLVDELMENIAIYRSLVRKFDDILSDFNKTGNLENSVEQSLISVSAEEKTEDISKPPRKKKSSRKLAKEEQDHLINKFIEAESEFKKPVKTAEKGKKTKEDLSQISSEFSDETVTETLAGIMVSQGKFEKAIDIYRKLIWKLPQKKAYFASQIELLKEKISKL